MKRIMRGVLVGAMTGCLVIGASAVRAGDEAKGQQEQKLTLDQVPAVVKDTLLKATEGGTLGDIEKEIKVGKTTYEADFVSKDGKKMEIKVDDTGKVLKIKPSDDDED